METQIDAAGIAIILKSEDMNDPKNLAFYTQLIQFKMDPSLHETVFKDLNNSQQRTLHCLAHAMKLEYEYSRTSQAVTVSKQSLPPDIILSGDQFSGLVNFGTSPGPEELPDESLGPLENKDLGTTLSEHEISTAYQLNGSNSRNNFQAPGFGSGSQIYTLENLPLDQNKRIWPQDATDFQTPLTNSDTFLSIDDVNPSIDTIVDSTSQGSDTPFARPNSSNPYTRDTSTLALDLASAYNSNSQDLFTNEPFTGNLCQRDNYDLQSPQFSPQQANSPLGSSNSIQGIRGQDLIKNSFSGKLKSNTRSQASSGYREIVFDSKTTLSSSQIPICSTRRGPMNEISRGATKAVKALKACWKCKFLRKPCKTRTPCVRCLKGSRNSPWQAIGCKRGTLKAEMSTIRLCPQIGPRSVVIEYDEIFGIANRYLKEIVDKRDQGLIKLGFIAASQGEEDNAWPSYMKTLLEILPNSCYSPNNYSQPSLKSLLNEYILAIVWELQETTSSSSILMGGKLEDLVTLLRSAAHLQADIEADRLILRSLICLHSSLEAMHIKAAGHLKNLPHQVCPWPSCKVTCLANLNLHSTQYLDELDSVFFNKERQHNRQAWWLSAFYSFCIQGLVRKALIDLMSIQNIGADSCSARQYLYLAIRLFIAVSGNYDPLVKNLTASLVSPSADNSRAVRYEHYERAQLAVQHLYWESKGIHSSADYLKQLFEDDGGDIKNLGTEKNTIWKRPSQSSTCDLGGAEVPSFRINAASKSHIWPSPTLQVNALPSPKITPVILPDEGDPCSDFKL